MTIPLQTLFCFIHIHHFSCYIFSKSIWNPYFHNIFPFYFMSSFRNNLWFLFVLLCVADPEAINGIMITCLDEKRLVPMLASTNCQYFSEGRVFLLPTQSPQTLNGLGLVQVTITVVQTWSQWPRHVQSIDITTLLISTSYLNKKTAFPPKIV